MFDSVFSAVERILGSKKVLIVFVGVAVDAIAAFGLDVDPEVLTSGIGAVFNLAVGGLAVGQFILDAIHGSASDGTVKKLAAQVDLEDDLEDVRSFISDLSDKLTELQDAAGEAEFEDDEEEFEDDESEFLDDEELGLEEEVGS